MSDSGLASHTGLAPSGMKHVQIAQYGTDKNLIARFYREPIYQEFASKGGELITGTIDNRSIKIVLGKGRPTYKEKVYCHMHLPGSKSDTIKEVPVALDEEGNFALDKHGLIKGLPGDGSYPTYPERFPQQWQQFLNQEEQTHSGTPLEMWPGLTKVQILELKGAQVHTVEQLGSLPDSTLQNVGMMDIRSIRDRAKAYMDRADDGAQAAMMMQAMDQMRIDNDVMRAQLAELSAERTEKRGPGRPRKETEE